MPIKYLSPLLDWIYPPTCIACRTMLPLNLPARYICEHCEAIFDPITAPICDRCGVPTETDTSCCSSCYGKTFHFTCNRATFVYDALVRDMMHEIKFREKKRVAQGLGELWVATIKANYQTLPTLPDFMGLIRNDAPQKSPDNADSASLPILVPLPMHPTKRRERGFDQAEILALALSRGLNLPMEKILLRTRDTPPQAGLHPRLRAENVKGVFAVRPDIKNTHSKNYILVDDIYTTGASLNECARILISAGAEKVSCMTFAIAVKNNDKD